MNQKVKSNSKKIPQVSIGMPVYNGEPFIREALDSLLAQTFTDFELIISDNASTDATEAICREYAAKDPRIRYVRQMENRGPVANFQFVLDEAVGEYFMWAAHDDRWNARYLEKAVQILEEDLTCNFVFPSFRIASIKFPLVKYWPESLFSFVELPDSHNRMTNFFNLHHFSHKCNIVYSLFRKQVISNAHNIQDLSNDGLLGLTVLYLGYGKHLSGHYFEKRYKTLWPGYGSDWLKYLYVWRKKEPFFDKLLLEIKRDTYIVIDKVEQNPIHAIALKKMFGKVIDAYQSHYYGKRFRIVNRL